MFENLLFFADYLSRVQGLSKNVLKVIDMYYIEAPPQSILGKRDASLNVVKPYSITCSRSVSIQVQPVCYQS